MIIKNRNKLIGFIFITFCMLWIGYAFYKSSHLTKNYKLTIGQINHISPPGRARIRGIDYEYFVNDKKLLGEDGIKVCDNYSIYDLSSLIVNKKFYVVYDTTDYSSSTMILTADQARQFNLPITDTLLHYDSIVNCMQVFGNY